MPIKKHFVVTPIRDNNNIIIIYILICYIYPLGRPRRRWEDNIKINLRDVGWVA
jgi:hypothetical protein